MRRQPRASCGEMLADVEKPPGLHAPWRVNPSSQTTEGVRPGPGRGSGASTAWSPPVWPPPLPTKDICGDTECALQATGQSPALQTLHRVTPAKPCFCHEWSHSGAKVRTPTPPLAHSHHADYWLKPRATKPCAPRHCPQGCSVETLGGKVRARTQVCGSCCPRPPGPLLLQPPASPGRRGKS